MTTLKNAAPPRPHGAVQRAAESQARATPPCPLAPAATFTPMKPYYPAPPGMEVRHPIALLATLCCAAMLEGAALLAWMVTL